ncbi:MAG: ATP-binding protein [Armatimonadetes bacterium]|nr:ATP-binding protein [Armatimonadota bacterium]
MIHRRAAIKVAEALSDSPVTILLGPRQCGKSTLARTFESNERRYATLDDPDLLYEAKRNPKGFLAMMGTPLILDEVQRAPELFLPLKLAVDQKRTPGAYLLTGSANVLLMPKVADSLAGRMEVIDLLPLTQAEMEGKPGNLVDRLFGEPISARGRWGEPNLAERIARGGFPEPALTRDGKRRAAWAQNYVRTLLDRDVRDLSVVEGLSQFPRLLNLLGARSGEPTNISSLSRELGIAHTTLTRYVELLKSLFLVQQVGPWSADLSVRLAKTPKSYLVDPMLLLHVLRRGPEALSQDLRPRLLESFVAAELHRLVGVSELRPLLLSLRTVKHHEVDFVLESPTGELVGLDVIDDKVPTRSHADGLAYLSDLAPDRFRQGIVLYEGTEAVPLREGVVALPISALWDIEPLS